MTLRIARWLVLALALAHSVAAQAQGKVARIGVVAERAPTDPIMVAFVDGLREFGYVDGQNIKIEWRYAPGANDRYAEFAAELVRLPVDVLVVGGSIAASSAKAATTTVPVVFTSVADPVAAGLVASLSRPGGNLTGLSNVSAELSAKHLEILKQAAPKIAQVAVLHDPRSSEPALKAIRAAARSLDVRLRLFEVRTPDDVTQAVSTAAAERCDAVLPISSPVIGNALDRLAAQSTARRLPTIYARSEFVNQGGLLSYGPSFATNYRRAAAYVDKILKGAAPGSLPVEQPTTFELVINLKAAQALGLRLPASLLQRADRIVE